MCGTAVATGETQIVDDVLLIENYIGEVGVMLWWVGISQLMLRLAWENGRCVFQLMAVPLCHTTRSL